MNLKSIRIKNFRCFEDKLWKFDTHFNVLIGNNATGKTTILDALSIGIGSFFLGIDNVYGKTILYKDIRKNTFSESREYQLPCEIEIDGIIGDENQSLIWQRSVLSEKGNTRREKDTNKLIKLASFMQKSARSGGNINLPVINYYGTGRLWQERKQSLKTEGLDSRFAGYLNALEPFSTSITFMRWLKTRTLSELQTQKKDEALVLVKSVVGCFLNTNQRINYDVKLDTIILEDLSQKGISRFEWNQMSDGYRNIIAMAADLAYRCYTLNYHLGIFAAEQSKGVVLIDEIDLHLHPSWQRTIVSSFKKAFPNIQFIVTTHSPFIVQSIKKEELIILEEGLDIESDPFRRGIEDISSGEMGVEEVPRSKAFLEMEEIAAKYYDLIKMGKTSDNDAEVGELRVQLNELEDKFSEDPAFVALLKSERKSSNL